MAQTAAQRKAAEQKAKQEQEAADAAAPAQEAPADEVDEFASTPASSNDTGVSDAEKLAEAEAELEAVKAERDSAQEGNRKLLLEIGKALGYEEEGEGVTIYDVADDVLAAAFEKLSAPESQAQTTSTNESSPTAAAIKLTVEEVDGAGKAIRRFQSLVPMAQANPTSVGETVRRTVEQIIAIPLDPAPALQQEPVED